MKLIPNKILSEGYIIGTIKTISGIENRDDSNNIPDEIIKFKRAINKSLLQIQALKKENKDLVEYLLVQELIIVDPEFIKRVYKYIDDNNSASTSIKLAMNEYINEINKSTSLYLKERVTDLEDVCHRLLLNVNNENRRKEIHPYILYTDSLYPSYLIHNREYILGVIAKKGGATSHSAILCRSFDIPYVCCNHEFKDNDVVLIDTRKKIIIKNPKGKDALDYSYELSKRLKYKKQAIPHNNALFLANVSSNLDLKKVVDYNFDGVGLYRTEMIFINTDRPFTFDEQFKIYHEAVNILKGRVSCFRTFDISDDKNVSYMKVYDNIVDTYKANSSIFEDQIKAMLKANKDGSLRIMFPLIENKADFDYLRNWVIKIQEDNNYIKPRIGMMLETGQALNNLEDFKDVDFISIGTNDLTKDLYHINRSEATNNINEYIDDLLNQLKPVVNLCNKYDICLSICGELASVKEVALKLYNIGIRNLSVSPSLIDMLNISYEEFMNNN